MITRNFVEYRKVANQLEDSYYDIEPHLGTIQNKIDYLEDKLGKSSGEYEYVCYLSFLCQELRTRYVLGSVKGVQAKEEVEGRVTALLRAAYFDPLSIISCASFYLYEIEELETARNIALYAIYIAEHSRAFVRHAHQTLIRIASKENNFCIMEPSVRRVSEYIPDIDSPDPSIEGDVIDIVRKANIDSAIKDKFFVAVEAQRG